MLLHIGQNGVVFYFEVFTIKYRCRQLDINPWYIDDHCPLTVYLQAGAFSLASLANRQEVNIIERLRQHQKTMPNPIN
jgi:hypothetical protein